MDFTLKTYRQLLEALLKADYRFFTFENYCNQQVEGKYVILRHDVDQKFDNSLETAKIEHELGIRASYFFRIIIPKSKLDIVKKIEYLGHEIGFHYENLSVCKGNVSKALFHFEKQLAYFRTFYPVKTISMHGSPVSKYDNRDLWKYYDYRDFGIIGEPYFDFIHDDINSVDGDRFYFTDTAGMWDGDKYNVRDKAIGRSSSDGRVQVHSTDDLLHFLTNRERIEAVMINTHPQRWTDNKAEWWIEHLTQRAKNMIKRVLVSSRPSYSK